MLGWHLEHEVTEPKDMKMNKIVGVWIVTLKFHCYKLFECYGLMIILYVYMLSLLSIC